MPFDAKDTRPIINFEKIVRGGHVLYMSLDSLPDPSVASAIGALALADLAARAGMRYNLGGYRRISLFVDEVSNVINQPLDRDPQQGRRGRHLHHLRDADAGRPGQAPGQRSRSAHGARQPEQPDRAALEGPADAGLHRRDLRQDRHPHPSRRAQHRADIHLGDFASVHSTQVTESFEEIVPSDVLGKLPNLQYFASVSGGRHDQGALSDPWTRAWMRRGCPGPGPASATALAAWTDADDPRRRGGLVGVPAGAGSVPALGAPA